VGRVDQPVEDLEEIATRRLVERIETPIVQQSGVDLG
jgi:hypothetical protein